MNQAERLSIQDRLLLILLVSVFASAWFYHPAYQMSGFAVSDKSTPPTPLDPIPLYEGRFASSEVGDYVHAPSVTSLPNGDLIAAWFSGSREGASDVEIHGARYNAQTREWGSELTLATRVDTETGVKRHIRKLGNPVIAYAPDGRLWLFYVSVSVGGWAGSAINVISSDDAGASWTTPRRLITSPFLNISTLVRGAPLFHRDGSIGLPVYHEFLGKFAEYFYLDANGRVLDKFRISKGRHSLQPSVVPIDSQTAIALLRYAGDPPGNVLACKTTDAGQTWSELERLTPKNPNSSLAAAITPDNHLLVALNDLQKGRFRLSLYEVNSQLDEWRPLTNLDEAPNAEGKPVSQNDFREIVKHEFLDNSGQERASLLSAFLDQIDHRGCDEEGCNFEFEYPYFMRSPDGRFHIVYAWNNSFIKHVTFNNAWREWVE